jgi:hypothetical protein
VSKHIFVKPSLDGYGQHVDQVVLAGKQFTLPRGQSVKKMSSRHF